MNRVAVELDEFRQKVDFKSVESKDRLNLVFACCASPYRSHACQQFFHAERLGDKIIGTRVQRRGLLFLAFAHGDDDDWELRPGPKTSDDSMTFDAGESEIEEDEVEVFFSRSDNATSPFPAVSTSYPRAVRASVIAFSICESSSTTSTRCDIGHLLSFEGVARKLGT